MPITDIQPAPADQPYTWGWDTESEQWVPVDRAQLERSRSLLGTLQNLGSAAGRGMEDVGLGLRQLTGDEVGADIENLRARQAAAGMATPGTEALGGTAPEIGAGVLAGLATGGLGFIPELAAASLAGGAATFARPGTIEDRITNAAMSVGLNAVGGAGVLAALKVGRGIFGQAQRLTGQAAQTGARRALTEGAAEARAPGQGASAAAPEGEAGVSGAGPRSVGAAQTPEDVFDRLYGQEAATLRQAEQSGADVESWRADAIRDRANELGMKVPFYAGTREGSGARLLAAGREIMPFGDLPGETIRATNQQKVGQYIGEALELKEPAQSGSIFADTLDDARASIGQRFEQIQERMPAIDNEDFVKAMRGISQESGPFGKLAGQKIVNDAIEVAEGAPGGRINGKQFMQSRSWLSGKMADLYKAGDTASGDTLNQAIRKLDDVAAQAMKRARKDYLAENYSKARQQWQLLGYLNRPSAVNLATGDVNWRTMFNAMRRDRTKGGMGGRPDDPAMRRVYDALEVRGFAETQVPFTGARMAAFQAAAPAMRRAVGTGLGAAAGLSLWD